MTDPPRRRPPAPTLRSVTGATPAGQRHWDLATVLDLVAELDPDEWPAFDRTRLERYLESVVSGSA